MYDKPSSTEIQPRAVDRKFPTIEWPPGVVGDLASWFYSIAPRPVREVAITAAIGVMAGIYGRAYNINDTGLNLYVVLVARSAIGKEAMISGIGKMMQSVITAGAPAIADFVDFSDFLSGKCLLTAIANHKTGSMLNVACEFGRKMRRMSVDRADGQISTLRTAMTNIYQKSSPGSVIGDVGYVGRRGKVPAVDGFAYSMIGETTPETFYESLSKSMIEDGFLSRFLVINYNGDRPSLNKNTRRPMPDDLCDAIIRGINNVTNRGPSDITDVSVDEDAKIELDSFDEMCDREINLTKNEARRQAFNRAHIKSLKLSALLAVADNPDRPVVNAMHAKWAVDLVRRDINAVMEKVGFVVDSGSGDESRAMVLLREIERYVENGAPPSHGLTDEIRLAGAVPRKYLFLRVNRWVQFNKHKLGAAHALDAALRALVSSGYLSEIPKHEMPSSWARAGRCFRINRLPENHH